MQTFIEWLSTLDLSARLRLLETYFTFNPEQYNQLFEQELEKVIQRVSDPAHRRSLEELRGFQWIQYIAASVRNAGFRDYRDGQEKIHDIATKLLLGKLFRGWEQTSGPMDLRFKKSVSNAIKNVAEKERNRRHYLPTVPIQQQFQPGSVTADELPVRSDPANDEKMIEDFRQFVQQHLGDFALTILDMRLAGGETKSLVGSPEVGGRGKDTIKRLVRRIKQLAQEFAASRGDSVFLRDIERAMGREETTVEKRRATTRQRQQAEA
jgi:hypothetical protein